MNSNEKTRASASKATEWRRQIMDLVFKGLLALNGAGAVALLAFLQAVWNEENWKLATVVIKGIGILTAGLVLAVLYQAFRYHTSLSFQKGSKRRWLWRYCYLTLMYLSVGAFIGAMTYLVYSMLEILNCLQHGTAQN